MCAPLINHRRHRRGMRISLTVLRRDDLESAGYPGGGSPDVPLAKMLHPARTRRSIVVQTVFGRLTVAILSPHQRSVETRYREIGWRSPDHILKICSRC